MTRGFQSSVVAWIRHCMGDAETTDVQRRARRFMEESMDLAQSAGLAIEDIQAVAEYVFNRPVVPHPGKEVGGTMVTLAALSHALDVHHEAEGWRELTRCWSNTDAIRAKNAMIAPGAAVPAIGEAEQTGPPNCPTCTQQMMLAGDGRNWVCTPCIDGLEAEAWEMYCDATTNNPHAVSSWERLPLVTRAHYVELARAKKAQAA